MTQLIKIALVDDHPVFRQGLKFMLSVAGNYNIVFEANSGEEFLEMIDTHDPDIVLIDISMGGIDGMEATKKALQKKEEIKIIAISSFGEEAYIYRMVKAGAVGFLQKTSDVAEIENAINLVYNGSHYFPPNVLRNIIMNINNLGEKEETPPNLFNLTKREKEVLNLICQGFSNIEIANQLNISPKTVDNHRTNLLSKTSTKNSAHLVMSAIKHKIINV